MRISDWSSDVCSSDLPIIERGQGEDDGAQPVATDRSLFEGIGDAAQRVRPGGVARPMLRQRPARRSPTGTRDNRSCGTFHEQMARRSPCRRCRSLGRPSDPRSEEHTSELQSLMRISYAVFCLNKKTKQGRKYFTQTPQDALTNLYSTTYTAFYGI